MKSILEKSVFVIKIAGKLLLGLEKYSKFTIFIRLNAINGDQYQYTILLKQSIFMIICIKHYFSLDVSSTF